MRVLVTDASYKHSIALQYYLKRGCPECYLIGHDEHEWSLARWYRRLDRRIWGRPLSDVLEHEAFDLVIPVGARSVVTVVEQCPSRAVLPERSQVYLAFDKAAVMELADELAIPHPITARVRTMSDLNEVDIPYPCVVKPCREIDAKVVYYARSKSERDAAVERVLRVVPPDYGALVQEYVEGWGYGVEVLYDRGRAVRLFMHERLREYPISGGASTAARATYQPLLKEYALRLFDALHWHGLAMAEFRYDRVRHRFVLMEINPKCWGSMELALCAGMNFPADLVRVFRGERLEYSEEYDRNCRFYWPLDGDLRHLLETRQLGRIREYWARGSHTNLGQSWLADAYKIASLAGKVVRALAGGRHP